MGEKPIPSTMIIITSSALVFGPVLIGLGWVPISPRGRGSI
jgi:hypothetical protein